MYIGDWNIVQMVCGETQETLLSRFLDDFRVYTRTFICLYETQKRLCVIRESRHHLSLGNVTWRHMWTKRHQVIWTRVDTRETNRDHRTKTFFWDSSHDQWDECLRDTEGHNRSWVIVDQESLSLVSNLILWQHILFLGTVWNGVEKTGNKSVVYYNVETEN